MSFTVINTNINYCGDAHDDSLSRMVKLVKKVDIIALQEAHTICFQKGRHFGEELAEKLGANVFTGINGTSIVSKHPIHRQTWL
jgi:endonuclease/exonuclease/phosphatase family metal-dependent hydrolase